MTDTGMVLRKVRDDITKYGLSVIAVPSDGKTPSLAYSVGLWQGHHHPEIVTFGLPPRVAHVIINDIGKGVLAGKKFKDGDIVKKLANFPVALVSVPKDRFEGVLNVCLAFYEHSEFEALQLVWPDREGRFPWQNGFDEKFRRAQPLLARLS